MQNLIGIVVIDESITSNGISNNLSSFVYKIKIATLKIAFQPYYTNLLVLKVELTMIK